MSKVPNKIIQSGGQLSKSADSNFESKIFNNVNYRTRAWDAVTEWIKPAQISQKRDGRRTMKVEMKKVDSAAIVKFKKMATS